MVIWIPVLWIATGVCLFAGVHFLTVGRSKDNAQLFTAFGALSIALSAYIAISALLQTPALALPWLQVERVHMAVACAIYPIGIWFISLYSRLRRWHGWVIAGAVVFGLALIADIVQPGGLLLARIGEAPDLILPWGEHIKQVSPTAAPTAVAYDVVTLLVFCWAFWRCWALIRETDWRRASALIAYLGPQAFATVYSELASMHQAQGLSGVDWSALPFLLLVVMVSQTLIRDLRRNALALDASMAALHVENAHRAAAEARLMTMAYIDAVSGLPNRHALDARLSTEFSRQPRLSGALAVMDPRRFALINHVFGHRAGDLMMREIAERLQRAAGHDGYVARLTGDEFAAVLPLPDGDPGNAAGAIVAARKLRDALAAPSVVVPYAPPLSSHIGLALLTDAGDPASLLRCAYTALQRAKATDAGEPVAFAATMAAATSRRLRLEADLHMAITQGQLHLAYQPQFDRAGRIVGAEALLRWEHAELGAVSPSEFIAIAEDSGQMPALGRFALQSACTDLAGFAAFGHLQLAINVSPRQLFLTDFVATVEAAIKAAAIDPHDITLEITETAFIHDLSDAAVKIGALNALGVRVSMDDFGTGYASIASLKAFPIQELKIDQSFVRDMTTTQPDRFVAAMIALGRALGITIVAEGVEREDQRSALRELGCDVFQGFLLGKPAPRADLAQHLAQRGTAEASA